MPVSGTCRPPMPLAAGSNSRIADGPSRVRPLSPLARPRRSSSSSAGISAERGRNDQLAASLVRDLVSLAESVHLLAPLDAVLRFEGARLVVEPGVDHAAVVSRLVGRQRCLGLEDDERDARPRADGHRGRHADDAAADDGDVIGLRAHASRLSSRGTEAVWAIQSATVRGGSMPQSTAIRRSVSKTFSAIGIPLFSCNSARTCSFSP